MAVKLVSDGTLEGTQLYNAETNEALDMSSISRIEWSSSSHDVTVTFNAPTLEVEGNFVKRNAWPCEMKVQSVLEEVMAWWTENPEDVSVAIRATHDRWPWFTFKYEEECAEFSPFAAEYRVNIRLILDEILSLMKTKHQAKCLARLKVKT